MVAAGDVFWIRADTALESCRYGYQRNGIRAIQHIVDSMEEDKLLHNNVIKDPVNDIAKAPIAAEN